VASVSSTRSGASVGSCRQHLFNHRKEFAPGKQAAGVGVGDQAREPRAGEQRREWHGHGADAGAGPVEVEQFEAVGQQAGDALAFADAEAKQGLGDTVDRGH
jgi:hypothetical protein